MERSSYRLHQDREPTKVHTLEALEEHARNGGRINVSTVMREASAFDTSGTPMSHVISSIEYRLQTPDGKIVVFEDFDGVIRTNQITDAQRKLLLLKAYRNSATRRNQLEAKIPGLKTYGAHENFNPTKSLS